MTSTGTGTRGNPVPAIPGTVPNACYWFTDPDGALCLSPGCMAWIQGVPTRACPKPKSQSERFVLHGSVHDLLRRQFGISIVDEVRNVWVRNILPE